MKKFILSTKAFTIFSIIIASAESEAQSAEGYDPEDEIYIKAETEYYWNGRYSNDRVFSEYLANELAGDYELLTNYAVGGAFSGDMTAENAEERTNWSPWLKGWGGVEQTQTFLAEVGGQADPKALYIISIGGNDSYAVEDLGPERAAELSSDYALEMVKNLAESGAKYILMPNWFEDDRTGLTDFTELRNQQVVDKVEEYLSSESVPDEVSVIYGHNQRLEENIEEQGFETFGYKSMGFYLISDWVPAYGYGLAAEDNSNIFPTSEDEDEYGSYPVYSKDSKYYNPEAAGWEPDDFYTYDEYHLSGRSHKHMATYLLNSDISTEDGAIEKVYNGEMSDFASKMEAGEIPSEYTHVYTFGDSSLDTGKGLEVTTDLVNNRDIGKGSVYIVRPRDNLWNIIKEGHKESLTDAQILTKVQEVYHENSGQIKDPNVIYPDQKLSLP